MSCQIRDQNDLTIMDLVHNPGKTEERKKNIDQINFEQTF